MGSILYNLYICVHVYYFLNMGLFLTVSLIFSFLTVRFSDKR